MPHGSLQYTWGALITEWGSEFDNWGTAFAAELAEAISNHARGKSMARKLRMRVKAREKLFFKKAQMQTIVRDEVVYDIEKLYDALGITADDLISIQKLREHIKKKLWEKLLDEAESNGIRIEAIGKKLYKFNSGIAKSKPSNTTNYSIIKESYSGFLKDEKGQDRIIKERKETSFKNELLELIEKYKPNFNSIKNILNEKYGKKKPTTKDTKSKLYDTMNSKWGLKDGIK